MQQIYQRKNFKVYKGDDCFILHNFEMEGFCHTHLKSIKQCYKLIQLSLEKRVPHDLSRYLLISLSRINEGEYRDKILEIVEHKKKKDFYYNKNGIKKGKRNG